MRKTELNLNKVEMFKYVVPILFSLQNVIVDITITTVNTTNGFSTSIICLLDNATQTIIR